MRLSKYLQGKTQNEVNANSMTQFINYSEVFK